MIQRADGELRSLSVARMFQAFRQESGPYDNGEYLFPGGHRRDGLRRGFYVLDCPTGPTPRRTAERRRLHLNPRDWRVLSTHGFWRGEVDTSLTYDSTKATSTTLETRSYIVTEDVLGVTGDGLREGDHIEEISNPHVQDEGTELTDAETLRAINCVGPGVAIAPSMRWASRSSTSKRTSCRSRRRPIAGSLAA